MVKVKKDLTGQRFGRLVVLEQAEDWTNKNPSKLERKAQWLCKCDCGNEKIIVGSSLTRGLTTSCGCNKSEKTIQRNINNRKLNKYDLSGEFGIGYTGKEGEKFYFDLEDYDLIKDYTWRVNNNGYGDRIITHYKEQLITMSRLIMGINQNKETNRTIYVDHINHLSYDNRKINLRIVTNTQNQMNKIIQSNNTSGVPGVYYKKSDKRWEATISINNQKIYLGSSKDKNKTIKMRKEAEEKYFGEYSYDNSMAMSQKV